MRKQGMDAWLAAALLSGLWLGGCARQEVPPAAQLGPADLAAEKAVVAQALHAYVDRERPEDANQMEIAQIAIDSGYALVTWVHGKEGGQAVLRLEEGGWDVMECGSGWLGLRGVCRGEVPEKIAARLLDQLDPNWTSYETY